MATKEFLFEELFARLNTPPYSLDGPVILREGTPVGILNPATLFGTAEHSTTRTGHVSTDTVSTRTHSLVEEGPRDASSASSSVPDSGAAAAPSVDSVQHDTYVYGPHGPVALTAPDATSLWAALLASGAVLPGPPHEVEQVTRLLDDPRTSRTASFMCCALPSLASILRAFERIRSAHVVLLGCGGIGSISALLLAGAGVGHLTCVDPDVVDESNLNRQILWTRADVGRPKVDVLRERIQERFHDVRCDVISDAVEANSIESHVQSCDAVILTADEPIGLAETARPLADTHDFTLVTTGYLLREALMTVHRPPTERASSPIRWARGPHPIMPSYGPTNAELAGRAAGAVLLAVANETSVASATYADDVISRYSPHDPSHERN